MAEVAAASSAAPSPSAQPTAQPAPGALPPAAPQPNFDVDAVRDAAPPDTQVRLTKPIKPIPRLPGVFPDDDPFPPAPPAADAADAATRSAVPPRGPDGRFVATSSATPAVEGEHTLEPRPTPPAAAPFEFAGERFPTREAAEQNFKSLRGQYRPIQSLAKSLGGVDKIVPQFQSAAESARGWKAEAERWQAVAEGRATQPAAATPTPQTADSPAADAATADVDWELYAEVKKLATEKGEPWKADQWLIEQVRKAERAHFDAKLDERDAPRRAQEAREALAAQTETLFGSLAEYTLEDGSPAFPELSEEAASYEIGRLWAQLGLPAQSALTPQGAVAAIALYRETKRRSQASPAAPALPPSAPPPSPSVPTDTQAAAGLTDGRPTVASVGGNGSPSAEAARILAGLRSINAPNRSVLGFDA